MTTTLNPTISRGGVVFLVQGVGILPTTQIDRATIISVRTDGSAVRVKESVGWHPVSDCFSDLADALAEAVKRIDVRIEHAETQLTNLRFERERLQSALEKASTMSIAPTGHVTIAKVSA